MSFSPGPMCALVGEANAGKSNLLAAMRTVLDPAAAPLTSGDAAQGSDGTVSIRVGLAGGNEYELFEPVRQDDVVAGSNEARGEGTADVAVADDRDVHRICCSWKSGLTCLF